MSGIPVYMSRYHTPLPPGYGAFVDWKIGERVRFNPLDQSKPSLHATIVTEIRTHERAPNILGARGYGRWVRDVIVDGEQDPCAVSEARIMFGEGEVERIKRELEAPPGAAERRRAALAAHEAPSP